MRPLGEQVEWDVPDMEEAAHQEAPLRVDFTDRYSTGVVTFDSVLKGGVPVGSLILMLTDEGAGALEFAFTSAAKLSLVKDKPDMKQFTFGDFCSHMQFPDRVTYVSLSRPRPDVLSEINASFDPNLAGAFERHVRFMDFSSAFFKGSRVPSHWIEQPGDIMEGGDKVIYKVHASDVDRRGTFLIDVVEDSAKEGIVYIDSLTDLIINHRLDNKEMMMILKGLRRVLHSWRGIVFFILHKGVLPSIEEAQFRDCFDAVMNFEWVKSPRSSKRQRYMHFEKFGSVMPILDREDIVRFATEVSYASGFVVVNTERIE
jgi:archaellum biogenesis ATPase FlaH